MNTLQCNFFFCLFWLFTAADESEAYFCVVK